ncbi:MAG TPA: site-2 protease family protein [Bryobacteraceae bacterium]|nr:site-2 protease family protein [Bryobacteraceae bacterium]
MRALPDRRVLIRYMFDALGFVFIFGHDFVVHSVLRADFWGALIFGEDSAGYAFLMAASYLYILPTALLCWITAAGLKRNKRWSFPVGVFTSALLVLGFPWLTIAGAVGLYVLNATPASPVPTVVPAQTRPTTDFWGSKRNSKAQPVVMTIFWSVAFGLQVWFAIYAHRAGMPDWHPGLRWWLWFSVFLLINTALHESGHAIVAWAAGFRLHVISIGPFTFWKEHSGFQFRFDLGCLIHSGGYMGAVPGSDRNLRLNQIAVIAAGPTTNALTCLVCLTVFFSLPGSAWQNWWWIAAFNAIIAGVGAVANLVPLGYCDGTMLLHLILGTPAGRLLLDRQRVIMMGEAADTCHGQAAFGKEIELKKAMLDRSLVFGQENAFTIAALHQALGSAYALVDDWPAAEFHYRRCLDFEAELATHPGLAGNAWSGLHYTSIRRHHVAAVGPAYASAIAVLEKQKTSGNSGDPRGPVVTFAMLAQAHLRNGSFGTALGEIERVLKSLPRDSNGTSQRAHALRSKAMCHLHLGDIDAGLAAARSAYDLFRSPEIPPARRNLAWEDVADLGHHLWSAGQSALSIDFLREGITHLESGGAALVAGQYRIKLARILRQLGSPDAACQELPALPPLFPALDRAFLTERAQLYLASGRPQLAVADCRELVDLWRAHSCAPAPEIASAEALLAKACLAAGDFLEAETLAIQAADVLGPWQHPDAASCLITLALARSQSTGECDSALIGEAFRLLESAVLLSPAEKARLKEAEAARIEQSHAAIPVLV